MSAPQPANRQPSRGTKAERRAATIEQILDAAELLFSQRGLYGVTLKDVAVSVGVHTSLMHYYFEDKLALFNAVFSRRAEVTNRLRMEALDRYEAEAGEHPTVEGALHAYLDTDLNLHGTGGEGWRNGGALGAQVSNTPEGAKMFELHFDPLVLRLVGILKRAMPDCSEVELFWGYHFVSGALLLTLARTGRIDNLSGGLCASEDFAAVKARMAGFMAAGFDHLRQQSMKAQNSSPDARPASSGAPSDSVAGKSTSPRRRANRTNRRAQ